MQAPNSEAIESLGALLVGGIASYLLGLAVCWVDVEWGSRIVLSAVPDPLRRSADRLFGWCVDVYPPVFACPIF